MSRWPDWNVNTPCLGLSRHAGLLCINSSAAHTARDGLFSSRDAGCFFFRMVAELRCACPYVEALLGGSLFQAQCTIRRGMGYRVSPSHCTAKRARSTLGKGTRVLPSPVRSTVQLCNEASDYPVWTVLLDTHQPGISNESPISC